MILIVNLGIALAKDQLEEYARSFPNAKLRIMCISDGKDNKSVRRVHDMAESLTSTPSV